MRGPGLDDSDVTAHIMIGVGVSASIIEQHFHILG